ncbi:hypothetical protein P7K49_036588 [Saguinus oedipus]|uniref:Centromere protein T n=1 Tax=Saguinus oedipus TaxID=9490 RepID=A0ABQ9TKM8_SAGOE|nr:hypothetical protein P7K49_036588 [Saguinus oedipus]
MERLRQLGGSAYVQASGHLEEQTPRTLLKNILLTAPESSILMPKSVVKPVPAPQVVQPSRRESSIGRYTELSHLALCYGRPSRGVSWGLQKPELGFLACLRSVGPWQEETEAETVNVSAGSGPGAASLPSSLNLTFATPLQPQSVQRPGLARRPPARRAVDVGAFLQDLRDTSLAPPSKVEEVLLNQGCAPFGRVKDSERVWSQQVGLEYTENQLAPDLQVTASEPVTTLPTDIVLEDTQPFSQPTVGCSRRVYRSLPSMPHTGAEDAELAAGCKTWSSGPGMQTNSPEKPAQFLAGEAEEVDAFALDFLSTSSGVSGEDGVEPLQDGVEEAEKRMEEGVSVSEMEATGAQGPSRAEEPEGHTQVTEAEESQGTAEAKGPGASSGDEDASERTASPELVSSTPESLQARRHHRFLEPDPPPGAAVLSSEPAEPLLVRRPPKPGTTGPRPQQDPHKAGLSHYVKLFSFYAKMPMERKALEMVEKCLDKYFQHLCDDLEVFAAHAGRKTVKPEDVELLMRRQGLVTDQVSLHVLVERYLPLEYRQLLIPCASSGNSVFPAQ